LASILKYFENAGSRHSDAAGDSAIEVSETQGVAWVLTDWKACVKEFPKYGQKIKVETWSEGLISAFGTSRNYYLYADEKLCVEGTSKWIRLDINKGRPVKVDDDLINRYGPEPGKTVFNGERLSKISLPENFSSETKIDLRRSDFDFNKHVHNLNYFDFALEALPQDALKTAVFKNARISYKTALKEGDGAIAKYAAVDGKSVVAIYAAGADGTAGALACAVELW
ncbi:MAG: hypothetical protein K6A42_03520, partial [Treponema sp.]|nr:hypothetical protein [Treponema sp.]